ncbi:4-hydroxyphenylpyruvate dioxygenase [Streptomyces sp. 110]|uniref:4-hydroxyphenylpyruvate dioxygenase n=1 Tax=Streptomyces endocoffeicus TaxID=2898945 RepID=A0ABS1PRD8_9ACTN|nr:4-hydroxyphenylpyruvate dioxygenase [Streptomyces endocoffeicus]MBL1114992.1 4-hydroxyphenylpyruvate dioxygenase [Streptomyces endocoffeicus]
MARNSRTSRLPELNLSHVEFYVADAQEQADRLADTYGFTAVATSGAPDGPSDHFSIALRQGDIALVVTEPRSKLHPAHAYVTAHGDGVADIAVRTADVRAAFDRAVEAGARPLAQPRRLEGSRGGLTAVIHGIGDVRHTFVQAPDDDTFFLPGFPDTAVPSEHVGAALLDIDHFAVCLEAGNLDAARAFYEAALGLGLVFEEKISVGTQSMRSQVVQNSSCTVTLTLLEPDPTADRGQIDAFLDSHLGAGVQHIAFRTEDIVDTVATLADRGVEFLTTPGSYYDLLGDRLTPAGHSIEELRRLNVLADEDHGGQLFQIFTQSAHPRRTFFLEIIERLGANTFGSSNIKALYEAVEAERAKSGALS